jgi:transcriptional regulator with XRE-family HTH domain
MERGNPGSTSGPLALFCARLKRLQMASGLSQAALAGAVHLGTSQMSDILNGQIKRLPDRDVTIAMVRACLEHAEAKGRPVREDLRDEGGWRRRYDDLEHDLDAEPRPGLRREAAAGWPLAKVIDPFALEVHRPVQPGTPQRGLPALPAYVAAAAVRPRSGRRVPCAPPASALRYATASGPRAGAGAGSAWRAAARC